jgi:hypothetical protein
MAIYKLADGDWRAIQYIMFDNTADFKFERNGDLVVSFSTESPHPLASSAKSPQARWHWDGNCFENLEQSGDSQCLNKHRR